MKKITSSRGQMGQKRNISKPSAKKSPHERREKCADEGWKSCSLSKRRAGKKVLERCPAEVEFTSLWVQEDQASSVPYSSFFSFVSICCPFSEWWHRMKRSAIFQFFPSLQIVILSLIHFAAFNRQTHYRCRCERDDCQMVTIICPVWLHLHYNAFWSFDTHYHSKVWGH